MQIKSKSTFIWATLLLVAASCVLADDFRINGQRYYVAGPKRVPWRQVRNILGIAALAELGDLIPDAGEMRSLSEEDLNEAFRQEIEWMSAKAYPANESCTFENWGQTEYFSPAKFYNPTCVEDIQAAVLEAKRDGKRIRAVGRTHSESPIFGNDGDYLIYTNNLRRITPFLDGPEDTWCVQVETGATTGDFKQFQIDHDVSIPSNVVLDVVKMGGVITAGCHGTGTHEVTVSDRVVELRIVDHEGVLRTYREGETPDHIMKAARVNLGLFGILYDFKIKVDPMRYVHVKDFKPTMQEVFIDNNAAMLKDMALNHYGVEFFWYPFNDRLWVKQFDLTDEEPEEEAPAIGIMQTFSDWIQMNFAILQQRLTTEISKLTPLFSRLALQALHEGEFVAKLPNAVHFHKFIDAARVSMYEIAINIECEEDWDKFIYSWFLVVNRTLELAEQGKFPFNMVMETRFIRQGTALLSPPRGNNLTVYLEVSTGSAVEGGREFFNEVADAWEVIHPKARIHWSKFSHFIPNIADRFKRQYGNDLVEFEQIRRDLNVDPDRMFFNTFFDQVFSNDDDQH